MERNRNRLGHLPHQKVPGREKPDGGLEEEDHKEIVVVADGVVGKTTTKI